MASMESVLRVVWSFLRGLADSLRGAVDLFLLDARLGTQKSIRTQQRGRRRDLLLAAKSSDADNEADFIDRQDTDYDTRPSRSSSTSSCGGADGSFAKRRALERRRQLHNGSRQWDDACAEDAQGDTSDASTTAHHRPSVEERGSSQHQHPRILERTVKCCALNGCVFWFSIVLFEQVLLPAIHAGLLLAFGTQTESGYEPGAAARLWAWTQPALSVTFSALWIIPFFLITKIVNAIWFQDIADSAFRSSRGRPQMMSSVSVMIADTVFSLLVESIFLLQGTVCSYLPITMLGSAVNVVHLCLLYSLYCFEYKWFNQGLKLHKRLSYIESHWPYFLGFGMPLALLTSAQASYIESGCVFSILFPVFIVSANQAQVALTNSNDVPGLRIFHPTMVISNSLFTRTFQSSPTHQRQSHQQRPLQAHSRQQQHLLAQRSH